MRKFTAALSLVLCLLLLTACSAGKTENQADNNDTRVFGDFSAKDLNGNEVTQKIFEENKLTMVNIWATFCGPCINEMPYLGELAEEYKDTGVAIIGIPVDITDANGTVNSSLFNKAVNIVDETNADYVHIVPTASMLSGKLASVYSVPETIFIDSEGNQVGGSYVGAKSKAQWEMIIENLLGEVQ